jgi:hypothetical protein
VQKIATSCSHIQKQSKSKAMLLTTKLSANATRFFLVFPMIAILLISLMMPACRSAQKYVESGDYDSAIDLCVRKLRGKKSKKYEYVQGLQVAFEKAQDRDIRHINQLVTANKPENWETVNKIHRQIRTRQRKIEPLLPLKSKNGSTAKFTFLNIEKLENESCEKAADFLYSQAEYKLSLAAKGDKLAARDAYRDLNDLKSRYFNSYKNSNALLLDARRLGTSFVLFEVKNKSNKYLPSSFEERVLNISKSDLDSEWKSYFFENKSGVKFDYKVVFNVRDVDISPERVSERNYIDEKEITDGWDYVLDSKGNVKKDTSGNDLKIPKKVRIRANVIEVFQSKAARLAGSVQVFDAKDNTMLDKQDLSTEVLFENYASTFKGDERALSQDTRNRIGNRPVGFPRDEDMLVQAADRLKPDLRDELRKSRSIL